MIHKITVVGLALTVFACGADKKEAAQLNKIDSITIKEVTGIANVEPLQRILTLTPETNGIIKKINIEINQKVQKGDILFVLDNETELAQLHQSESKLATQLSVIEKNKAALKTAETNLSNAKTNISRSKNLFESNAITKKQWEDEQLNFETKNLQAASAQADLQQAQKRLAELKSDVEYYQTILSKKTIKAPLNGTILSVDTKLGSNVATSTALSDFAPDGPVMAITEIDELFADKIKVGQPAYVRAQGDSIVLARGKVILAAPYLRKKSLFSDKADNLEDRRVREVRVQLDSTETLLIGSRVECIIELK
ncbi:HlyD family secretion protein [Cytophaga hutchinsonii]|uniref:Possible membrane protein n=1 Tax=Cytophaga hutchinsonii (strain ATCC 33406 / DSM 1761 / CIP 103989 / NBRC 15051 / NCIMB 9469 / D465) TaxID=269798 RepID=A0A6N4STV4_CYTH3|nr:efflux RND transporter periplasmic adaptor subunit [Cytophaga hutchinsonii]ABG59897.1 possible membrane protein [Cytophaga hutchinsonii ATCC 33406]SFX27830.1 HlyD family secretion protein [Cytophaga hutchinsonii ATCC 33406]